ncbi:MULTISPECIES: hypothetical protein [unclassified Bradyrhizobium]|uniref:hypothetical protein n=1 Tax=unclassified Bradyrhizobium TaxID=2631580 RepID=UPI001FFB0810|nr:MULTISPECIES: hypothetical protein [unclassified Bradyrhizobium]MCK1436206.1 hypothetical protein [Bradyrhizobium sp. 15]MCK1608245.1 hypothetical protein [Bradyrhizobium sp. 163]MCK1766098.1 hypothetical protein [Bradyrhizobium sp. 136]
MASAGQIAANRLNARKSTGPRSAAGRWRTRKNASRHGLAAVFSCDALAEINELARQFANEAADPMLLQHALDAAHAEFILVRVKLWRIAWLERTYATGSPQDVSDVVFMREMRVWLGSCGEKPLNLPSETMPPPGRDRCTEAIRRALPELAKLDRYESRALARRDRAFRALLRPGKTR